MRALIDCNNFFVSCERIFNPSLNGRPVVVMSGNDGCVIARSNEAKALGIPMGAPVFEWRNVIEANNVKCFSSNHILYSDISRRIMTLVAEEVDNIQIYSVDEAFFDIEGIPYEKIPEHLTRLAMKVEKYVGVPVSIGASRSRTLAKIASHIAKKECLNTTHSYILDSREDVHRRLAATPVDDVWGIGRRLGKRLMSVGVNTAADFARLPRAYVKENLHLPGERTWLELHGVDCSIIQALDEKRQSVSMSRTFKKAISSFESLSEAVATFAHYCAASLRTSDQIAGEIMVFATSSRFDTANYYANSASASLPSPSSDSLMIVTAAMELLRTLYRPGVGFKKAGVALTRLSDNAHRQLSLFSKYDYARQSKLMNAIDSINRAGIGTVSIAAMGTGTEWKPKCSEKSREFTTSLSDILVVNCK